VFSGIVEEKGRVRRVKKTPGALKLTVESKTASGQARIGDSVSINGVCLTVVKTGGGQLEFDVMEETMRGTNISSIRAGEEVNVEMPLAVGGKVSGHFVTGHIDCVGKINSVTKSPSASAIDIELPEGKAVYAAEKGSIAIDGVGLTVAEVDKNNIKVCLIPLTLKRTNLGSKKAGGLVNIEFDILGKYALKKTPAAKKGIDADFLKEHGFL